MRIALQGDEFRECKAFELGNVVAPQERLQRLLVALPFDAIPFLCRQFDRGDARLRFFAVVAHQPFRQVGFVADFRAPLLSYIPRRFVGVLDCGQVRSDGGPKFGFLRVLQELAKRSRVLAIFQAIDTLRDFA